jgi:hypothetical protein
MPYTSHYMALLLLLRSNMATERSSCKPDGRSRGRTEVEGMLVAVNVVAVSTQPLVVVSLPTAW